MEFVPSIKSIVLTGLIALVIFGALAFITNFASVGGMIAKAGSLIPGGQMPSNLDSGASAMVSVGMGYLWANLACFTGIIGNFANALTPALASRAGAYGTLITPGMVTQQLNNAYSTILPPTYLYYIFGILAGFIGGLAFLRRPSRLVDSLLAAVMPALVAMLVIVVIGSFAGAAVKSSAGSTSSAMSSAIDALFAVSVVDMLLIFLVTYAFITIGAFAAALLWMLIKRDFGGPAPAPAPKPRKKK